MQLQNVLVKFVYQGPISRLSGQSQTHRSKKRVCVSCSWVVCIGLEDRLVYQSICCWNSKN